MSKTVHVISFDVPYPPNYGGIVDVFFKIRSLHRLGYQVILHCFEYRENEKTKHLDEICHQVYYYKRRSHPVDLIGPTPYIIGSRKNPELIKNLLQDDAPIIFEGLHCCYYLQDERLQHRKRLVRMHNIEWKYYHALAQEEKNPLKKVHFQIESHKLKKYESEHLKNIPILSINPAEDEYLMKEGLNSQTVEAFHPYDQPEFHPDKKDYILFHGSLDVHENIKSALWICEELATRSPNLHFYIAGKSPDKQLVKVIANHPNVEIIQDPSVEHLQTLIKEAYINLIITFQNTGIKLKLLNALFVGGHCIANSQALYASELEAIVNTCDDPREMSEMLDTLMHVTFTSEHFEERSKKLMQHYDNQTNAKKIARLLYS